MLRFDNAKLWSEPKPASKNAEPIKRSDFKLTSETPDECLTEDLMWRIGHLKPSFDEEWTISGTGYRLMEVSGIYREIMTCKFMEKMTLF